MPLVMTPRADGETFERHVSELAKYGNLQEMHVCDNVGDHLLGNVYARYEWEAEAQKAVDNLNDRWYSGELPSVSVRYPHFERYFLLNRVLS